MVQNFWEEITENLDFVENSNLMRGSTEEAVRECSVIKSSCREEFCRKGVLRNFAKFTGKHLRQILFLKKRLWHKCFPVNLAKFLRTPFFTEHLWWLLLWYKIPGKIR